MDRGENLFAQNWVEQWKNNVVREGSSYHWGVDSPTLDAAAHYGCDIWSWSLSTDGMWRARQDRLFPHWWDLERIEEDNARTRDKSPVGLMR